MGSGRIVTGDAITRRIPAKTINAWQSIGNKTGKVFAQATADPGEKEEAENE